MATHRRLDLGQYVILAVLFVGTVAMFTRDQWDWVLQSGDAETTDVDAPTIDVEEVDPETERLYRIVPNGGSAARYVVDERLAGQAKTTIGTTTVLGGDLVIDTVDPTRSTVGEIVVNVEMFSSDSALRDKRLRHDFLASTHFPFARFVPSEIVGLPDRLVESTPISLEIIGDLTIKETTLPVTFTGVVVVAPDRVVADMQTTVLGSSFDVGPINIARLAHTDDEIVLELDLVAGRVDLDSDDGGSLESDIPSPEIAGGAFAAEVQPILEARCVGCHTSGGPGWSTLALDTAADAASIATDIALVTGAGYMPPWLPSEESVAFHNDWSLSDEELQVLADWAADGGGLDIAPATPLVSTARLVNPIERDVVSNAAEAYVGSEDRKDDYRCQLYEVPDPEGDGTWLTGMHFEPDETSVVHHAIVYRAPAAARAEVEEKSARDDQPGYTCYGASNLQTDGVYQVLGWAPGQQPTHLPDGIGIYLAPGDFLVNQIHYHFDHEFPADNSTIVLQTATRDELEAGMRHIRGSAYLTPAEMPCTPQEVATGAPLCDRDAVLDDIAEKYGMNARRIPDALLNQCGGTVDDYDDLDGTVAHSSCDLRARNTGTIFSVLAHMHEFGAAYRMTLHPDTPDEIVMLDIPTWSFEWQLAYEPIEAIRIERGDVVRFECWWDRSLVHLDEPRYVTWNEGTVDEMCYSSIRVIPDP
ncbi:MAG: YceI family protein [Actinomycetota bacterium]